MPYDLSKLLVTGVSSRALFDLRWYSENLKIAAEEWAEKLLLEFEESAKSIPLGAERRAVGEENTRLNKLLRFRGNLVRKHRPK